MKKIATLFLDRNQTHIGHCQLNYWTRFNGKKIKYCLQDNGEKFGGIRLMRCSQDYEPEYEIKVLLNIEPMFEMPIINDNDSEYTIVLKILCRQWIDNYSKRSE